VSSAASTEIQAALFELVAGRDLSRKQMASLVRRIHPESIASEYGHALLKNFLEQLDATGGAP